MPIARLSHTPATVALLRKLRGIHGDLLFHQSGGCCDGSAPMCYPINEFKIGERDVYLGDIDGTPFYISPSQFEYWQHTKLTIDVVPGRGSGFSVESPEGVRFLTRSDVYTEEQYEELDRQGPPPAGPGAMAHLRQSKQAVAA